MADYFTNFSLQVRLPDEAAQTYALNLAEQASRIRYHDEPPDSFPGELQANLEDWCFEVEPDVVESHPGLWLHSSDGGIDAVCAFIQHLLQQFDPTGRVTFQWSHDCSKPRTDAYGGGAAFITAQEIKTMSTHQWLQEQTATLNPTTQKLFMDDCCCMQVTCRRPDQPRFEALGFHLEFEPNPDSPVVELIDEQASYAHRGELPTGIPFLAAHDPSENYGGAKIASDGKHYAEVEAGHDGGFVVRWDDKTNQPARESLECLQDYRLIHQTVRELFTKPAAPPVPA